MSPTSCCSASTFRRTRSSAPAGSPRAPTALCIGSSLEVHPVAGLPRLTLRAGGDIAIVTQGSTPLDRDAAVKPTGDVETELQALVAAL